MSLIYSFCAKHQNLLHGGLCAAYHPSVYRHIFIIFTRYRVL